MPPENATDVLNAWDTGDSEMERPFARMWDNEDSEVERPSARMDPVIGGALISAGATLLGGGGGGSETYMLYQGAVIDASRCWQVQ